MVIKKLKDMKNAMMVILKRMMAVLNANIHVFKIVYIVKWVYVSNVHPDLNLMKRWKIACQFVEMEC